MSIRPLVVLVTTAIRAASASRDVHFVGSDRLVVQGNGEEGRGRRRDVDGAMKIDILNPGSGFVVSRDNVAPAFGIPPHWRPTV